MEAWRIPPVWKDLQGNDFTVPEGSSVPKKQRNLLNATQMVLESIAKDVRGGLLETVGVECSLSLDDKCCSMVLELPVGTVNEQVARAIDAENIESWLNAENKVCAAISPWYSTKDVDQTVLSTIKVVHVLLGIHATDAKQPKTLKQKLLKSIAEIMEIQKSTKK